MINKALFVSCFVAILSVVMGALVFVDSYSCDFKMNIPNSTLTAECQQGVFQTKTRIEQGDERYKIHTKAVYLKVMDRILILPFEKDIDVEMKGSMAVYNAEKIKTPHRTFGNQPYSSMSLIRSQKSDLLGVAIFSDPNSIYVPVKYITGTF